MKANDTCHQRPHVTYIPGMPGMLPGFASRPPAPGFLSCVLVPV
jgi:hypothetical protein